MLNRQDCQVWKMCYHSTSSRPKQKWSVTRKRSIHCNLIRFDSQTVILKVWSGTSSISVTWKKTCWRCWSSGPWTQWMKNAGSRRPRARELSGIVLQADNHSARWTRQLAQFPDWNGQFILASWWYGIHVTQGVCLLCRFWHLKIIRALSLLKKIKKLQAWTLFKWLAIEISLP